MDISVTIYLTINDEQAFRQAAHDRALADDLGEEEAKEYLDAEAKPITDCAIMLLDPGISPPGSQIHESTSE